MEFGGTSSICLRGRVDGKLALKFHKEICGELLNDDGLVVMAEGLGVHEIVMRFIKLYSTSKHLVFVLNLEQERQFQICCELQSEGISTLPSIIVDSTLDERCETIRGLCIGNLRILMSVGA